MGNSCCAQYVCAHTLHAATKIMTWSLNFKLETWLEIKILAMAITNHIIYFPQWINIAKLILALKSRWLERSYFILFFLMETREKLDQDYTIFLTYPVKTTTFGATVDYSFFFSIGALFFLSDAKWIKRNVNKCP